MKCQEDAQPRALIGCQREDVLPLEKDLALRDLVGGVPHESVSQGGLASAIRTHDGVNLSLLGGQIHPLQDLLAVNADVKVLDFQL